MSAERIPPYTHARDVRADGARVLRGSWTDVCARLAVEFGVVPEHATTFVLVLRAAVGGAVGRRTPNARDGGGAVHRQVLEAKRAVERDEGWYFGHP